MLGQDAPEREPFPTGIAIGVAALFVAGLIGQYIERRLGLPTSGLERPEEEHHLDAAEKFVERAQEALVRNLTSGNVDCPLAFKQLKRTNLDLGWWRGEWAHVTSGGATKAGFSPETFARWHSKDPKFHNNQIALNRLFKSKCVLSHTPVQLGSVEKRHTERAKELLARANLELDNVLKQLRQGDCRNASDTLSNAQLLRAEGSHEASEAHVPMARINKAWDKEQKANALFTKTCLYGERDVLGPPPVIPKSLDGMRRRRAR